MPCYASEEGELEGEEAEGFAVEGGGAEALYGGTVGGGGVAFVHLPVVAGKAGGEGAHGLVAVGFGEDGGCGDVAEAAVAFDKGFPGEVGVGFEAVAVDDDTAWAHRQGVEGAVHGQDAGVEYVDVVDLLGRALGHGPGYGLLLDDGAQGLAATLCELL